MTLTTNSTVQPLFLPGTAGALFALYRAPGGVPADQAVVFVPPFAEEMNKSRRMVTLCAEALSVRGVASLVLDLYGTGDSAGGFAEGRWEVWRADVVSALKWMGAQGHRRLVLVGLRLGALLALDAARAMPDAERIVLWQPVNTGDAMMTQFLRMDVATQMLAQTEARASTESMRQRLRGGEPIEVAGYMLAPALVSAIDALRLESLLPDHVCRIDWIEVAADPTRGGTPAGNRVRQAWLARGRPVGHGVVKGSPFWSSVEIVEVPELVHETIAALECPA